MSKQQTSVVGTVLLTALVTSALLVGGWFAFPQFFNRQPPVAATSAPESVDAPAAPRKKARKAAPPIEAPQAAGVVAAVEPASTAAAADANADRAPAPSAAASATPPPVPEPAPAPIERADQPVATPPAAPANDLSDARAIVFEAQRRSEAQFYRYDGLLQSFDSRERVTEKRWNYDRAGSHGQSKTVIRFTSPAEVKGVALLIVNHPNRASDQWMWTPAIERDRRIALQDRSTRVFGTDFSFEDLEERDVDQFDYTMLGDEPFDGADCWKIQMVPKASHASQYSRSITWIRKDTFASKRLDNFVGADMARQIVYSNIERIQNIWTARQLDVRDMHRGTHTRLVLDRIQYNLPKADEDFTLQAIRR